MTAHDVDRLPTVEDVSIVAPLCDFLCRCVVKHSAVCKRLATIKWSRKLIDVVAAPFGCILVSRVVWRKIAADQIRTIRGLGYMLARGDT